MNDVEIKKAVTLAKSEISIAERDLANAEAHLEYIQKICPHTKRESWTNNDGVGQFKVEKCKVCGLQKDGGLD